MGWSLINVAARSHGEIRSSNKHTQSLWLLLVVATLMLAGINNAHAQWGQQNGGTAGDPLLAQLDIYFGAGAGRWSFDLDENNDQTYESQGGTVFAGIQLIDPFLSVEQRFTYGGSDSSGDKEVELEGVWSTVFRLSLDLTTWNQLYVLGGISAHHFTVEEENGNGPNDEVDIANFSAGVGLTHRVSERAWLYVERFFFDGIDGDFHMEVSGGAFYRF
ncbi:hypothetical protein CKO08_07685 [Halorhodospira halochloris]|nr:hypothetical protein [Halorhodospira halochloris]